VTILPQGLIFHRTKDTEVERKMDILVSQAIDLYYASDKKEVTESEEYKMLERFFREQKVDSMPVRGLLRSKFWFGFKIAAMNFKR